MTTLLDTGLQRLQAEQLLAVIRASSARDAVRAGLALAEGGVRALEVAFTTPDATAAIAELAQCDDVFVGAGTVRTQAQAHQAVAAGARFMVSPSLVSEVLDVGETSGILAIPGALTPTEIVNAAFRAEVVKLFPASLGGPRYLRALLAPLPELRIVPTGGVDVGNVGTWLAAGAFALGAGGDLCPPKLIAAGDFAQLTALARRYRAALDAACGERA